MISRGRVFPIRSTPTAGRNPCKSPIPFVIAGGGDVETLRHKSSTLDDHCAAIDRDPADIIRSAQFTFDAENPADTRRQTQTFIDAGYRPAREACGGLICYLVHLPRVSPDSSMSTGSEKGMIECHRLSVSPPFFS